MQKLKAAQKAWLAFRDAQLQAMYPAADKQAEYGSVYPTCRCAVLKELTEQRTRELKVWLDGIPEGEVCRGSVKTAARNGSGSQAIANPAPSVELPTLVCGKESTRQPGSHGQRSGE